MSVSDKDGWVLYEVVSFQIDTPNTYIWHKFQYSLPFHPFRGFEFQVKDGEITNFQFRNRHGKKIIDVENTKYEVGRKNNIYMIKLYLKDELL